MRSTPRGIWLLAAFAVALRLVFMLVAVDLESTNYNEFGEIARNMRAGNGFALFHIEGGGLSAQFSVESEPFPSAFMPPGYVLYVYPFLAIESDLARNVLLLLLQHAIGGLCVVLAFNLARRLYGDPAGWIAAALMAVLPDMVAASSTFGATVFVHAIVLGLFIGFESRDVRLPRQAGLWFGGLLAALVLFRFEALGFALLMLVVLWRKWGAGLARTAALALVVVVAPWMIRNTVVFDRPILSTSLGLNAFRGNNAEGIGVWSDPEVRDLLPTFSGDQFEARLSEAYFIRAARYAAADPAKSALRSMEKIGRLWLFDPDDDRAKHRLRLFAWGLVVVFALVGCFGARPPVSIVVYILFSTSMAALFFALARHQVLMEVALIPLAGHGLARFCTFVGYPALFRPPRL